MRKMTNEYEVLAEKKFKTRVVSETAYGINADYGVREQTMKLIQYPKNLVIEWFVGDEKEPIDEAIIGITTIGKKVIDYDGVFELPSQAIQLLNEYGLDTKEVEDEVMVGASPSQ